MSAPDLTLYRVVHRAIRGGTAALAEGAVTIEAADAERRTAFARYWKGYAGEVLAHHRSRTTSSSRLWWNGCPSPPS